MRLPAGLMALGSLCASVGAPRLAAQDAARLFCPEARRADACRTYMLFEVSVATPLWHDYREVRSVTELPASQGGTVVGRPSPTSEFAEYLAVDWELGYMVNVGEHWAVGASAGRSEGHANDRRTFSLRVRRWLGAGVSAELVPAAFVQDQETVEWGEGRYVRRIGGRLGARLSFSHALHVSAGFDLLEALPSERISEALGARYVTTDPGGSERSIWAAVGLGGMDAVAGTLVLGFALMLGVLPVGPV